VCVWPSCVCVQVNFSEPLSFLQRLTEDFEYSDCLDNAAAQSTDQFVQLAYVAAFAVSSYANTTVRTGKPFNPLLGETYECDRLDDLGWRAFTEQVHHFTTHTHSQRGNTHGTHSLTAWEHSRHTLTHSVGTLTAHTHSRRGNTHGTHSLTAWEHSRHTHTCGMGTLTTHTHSRHGNTRQTLTPGCLQLWKTWKSQNFLILENSGKIQGIRKILREFL